MKGTAKNPREAALLILEQIFLRGAYANLALAQGLRGAPLSPLDRKLTTELVYGTVKTMGTLDWYLSRVVNRPLRKLDPLVLVILRLGAYQLLYLDRIPASAACNESVKLAKKWVHEGAGKLVNGALRQLARTRDQWKFPQGPDHELERIALEYYHPEWLVRRWKFRYGLEEAVKLCAFDNARPAFSFRVNTLRDTREGSRKNWRKRASGPGRPNGLRTDCFVTACLLWMTGGRFRTGYLHPGRKLHAGRGSAGSSARGTGAGSVQCPGREDHPSGPENAGPGRNPGSGLIRSQTGPGPGKCPAAGNPLYPDGKTGWHCFCARMGKYRPPGAGGCSLQRPGSPEPESGSPVDQGRTVPESVPAPAEKDPANGARYRDARGNGCCTSTCTLEQDENTRVRKWFLENHPEFAPAAFPHPLTGEPVEELQILPQRDGINGFYLCLLKT